MIDYQNLRNSYITALHMGIALNASYEEAKRGNDILHKFCENCVDSSNYSEQEKQRMKHDLELLKEALTKEIQKYYTGTQQ